MTDDGRRVTGCDDRDRARMTLLGRVWFLDPKILGVLQPTQGCSLGDFRRTQECGLGGLQSTQSYSLGDFRRTQECGLGGLRSTQGFSLVTPDAPTTSAVPAKLRKTHFATKRQNCPSELNHHLAPKHRLL